jgi:DNA polymerase III epsilon subunit family exonuclease
MGIFDKLFGKKKQATAPAPSPIPVPVREPSPYELQEAAIARNPLSAKYRTDYTDTANFTLLELNDYLFGSDPLSFVAFDLETTGFNNAEDSIIEIGAVRVSAGEIVDRFQTFVNPDRSVPRSASSVNHITDDMLIDAPHIYEVLPDFLEFAGSDVLVAHNARFDSGFVAQACLRYRFKYPKKYFDSMNLTFFWPDLPDRKLSTLLHAACVENQNAHRALSDAESLAQLMIISMNKEFNLPLPEGFDPGYSIEHFSGEVDIVDNKLSKRRFVITGKIENYERSDFEKMILSHGGKCTQKASTATDFLVVGSFPGLPKNYVSKAVINARKLIADGAKLQIISPADVLKMTEES